MKTDIIESAHSGLSQLRALSVQPLHSFNPPKSAIQNTRHDNTPMERPTTQKNHHPMDRKSLRTLASAISAIRRTTVAPSAPGTRNVQKPSIFKQGVGVGARTFEAELFFFFFPFIISAVSLQNLRVKSFRARNMQNPAADPEKPPSHGLQIASNHCTRNICSS